MSSIILAILLFAVILLVSLFLLVSLLKDKEYTHKEKALSYLAVTMLVVVGSLMLRICIRNYCTESIRRGTAWVLVSDHTTATVYNPVPEQCNADCLHTASMFSIDPRKIAEYRIVAMERTMMEAVGITYGDTVLVVGAGRWDGEWQVQDTMNKRFAGQHKIDFMVPKRFHHGIWENVKVYKKI